MDPNASSHEPKSASAAGDTAAGETAAGANRRGRESALAAQIDAAGLVLFDLVQALDPRDVPVAWAPEVMDAFTRAERSAAAGRVLMAAQAAKAPTWKREGYSSAAEWMAFQQGTTVGRARDDLATSELLPGLEATSDALRSGQVSPEEAAAIADAAAVNPEAEEDLIDVAENESLRKTREAAARRKAEAESEEAKRAREARVRKDRKVQHWVRDGAGFLKASGPVADIADLAKAIEDAVSVKFRQPSDPASREGYNAAKFDALVGFGRNADPRSNAAPAAGSAGVAGGGVSAESPSAESPSAESPSAPPTSTKRRPPRPDRVVMVRVDLAALLRGSVTAGELCEIAGFGPISVTEARRMMSDSVLAMVLANGEAVVDVVNLSRKPTVAQKFAELFNNPHCAALGCNSTVAVEFDHRADWAKTYRTTLPDLDRLCRRHHDLKTYEGWTLDPGVGRRKMRPPNPEGVPRPSDEPISVPGQGAAHGADAPVEVSDPATSLSSATRVQPEPDGGAAQGAGASKIRKRRPPDNQQETLLI